MICEVFWYEGLIFTPTSIAYRFGMNDMMFSWKHRGATLDLMYQDGWLYSSVYDNRKNFVSYKKEGKLQLKKRDGVIVEVKFDYLKSSFSFVRERIDKWMPNASTTVEDIRRSMGVTEYAIERCFRTEKYFYTSLGMITVYRKNWVGEMFKHANFRYYRLNDYRGVQEFMMREYAGFESFDDVLNDLNGLSSAYFRYPMIKLLFGLKVSKYVLTSWESCPKHAGVQCLKVFKGIGSCSDLYVIRCVQDFDNEVRLNNDVYEYIIKHYEIRDGCCVCREC